MSDTYLKLISIVPGFVPDKLKEEKAQEFLNKSFANCETEFVKTDDIEFVDQGTNFESVSCNYCGAIGKFEVFFANHPKTLLPNKKRIFAKNIRPLYGFDRRILFRSPTA